MGAAGVKKEETMKTVTIPNNMRPWRCIVNGVKYEYPGGTVQTVPDEVAALIAEWKRNQPPKRDPVREPVEKDYGSEEIFYIGADAKGVYRVNQAGVKKYMDEDLPELTDEQLATVAEKVQTEIGGEVEELREDITYINNSVFTQSKELWCPNGRSTEVFKTSTFSGFATSWEIAKETYVKDLNFKVRSRADANITEIRIRIENADFAFEKSFIVDIGRELTDVKIEVDCLIPDGVVWIGIAANQICTFAHDSDTDKHYTYWTDGSLDKLSQLKETGGVVYSLYLVASVLSDIKFIDKVETKDIVDRAITQNKLSFADEKIPDNLFDYTSEEMCKVGYWYYSNTIGAVLEAEKSINTESTYTAIKIDVFSSARIVIDSPDTQDKKNIQYIGAVDEQMRLIDYIFERKKCPITYEIPSGTKYILLSVLTVSDNDLAALMVSGNGESTHYISYQKPYYYLNDCKADAETPTEIPIIQTIVGEDENTVGLCVPKQYALVKDDTFELFYKGVINASNYKMFDMVIECKKGNAYHNKFVITPDIAEDLTLSLTLYGINHNVLDKKNILLKVMNKATSPVSSKNVLCVGDSLTTGGDWVKEFNRRLTATDGTPIGDGLNNINFVGSREIGGVHYEGYGGWTFASYNTENINTNVQIITCTHNKTSDDQHSVYRDALGGTWKLETIEDTKIKIIAVSSEGRNFPESGTLTWVSGGVNHESIEYSASTVAPGNPFWNETTGMVDFASYATKQNITDIDYVYVLLGWNSAFATEDVYKSDVRTFINNILSAFPACKIVLMGLQIPARDGLGVNYGATGIYSRYYDLMQHVWRLDKWYTDIAAEYPDNVSCISIAGQFDTENNMFESTRPVNVRNSRTETYQTNGVHPAPSGYYQIADAAYRNFVHKLNN